MTDAPYNPARWFWIVGGDESRFWSSAAGAYISTAPADATPTRIASERELTEVLNQYGLVGPSLADLASFDQAALTAALIAPGSVVRALGLVMFAEINKLRVKGGDPAYTLAQFKAALQAQMRG